MRSFALVIPFVHLPRRPRSTWLAAARAVLTLALIAVASVLWVASPARAQADNRAPPVPASLIEIMLISQSDNQTKLRLTFAPRANTFGVVGGTTGPNTGPNGSRPSLGFALSSRGNGATTPSGLNGLVRAIGFEQVETVLILRFSTTQPARVTAAAVSSTVIEVTVSNGVQNSAQIDGPVVGRSGTLPSAREPLPGEDGFELVFLKYADVSEVVGLLTDGLTVKSNDYFSPREPGFGSTSLTGSNSYNPGPTAQSGSSDQPLGQSVDSAIAVDRRLNAVWLKGSSERIARLKKQIEMIDVAVDSVVLETQLVELTETGARAVGIDFANANGQIGVATAQTGQYISPGYQPNQGGHFQFPDDLGNRGSIVGGRLVGGQIQAAIYAQVQKGQGKIVSRPRIAAQSGSTAKIITGDALPILTAITLSGVNGVSQQVQYVNVGVTLQIAPRVSSDGFVSSHVFCVVSSVTGFSQGYPTISQREAETSATVRDGDSFVIGGLTQESSITSRSKIPLLGDIPLFGQAFRTDRGTKSKTELYIVITPHIVRRYGAGTPAAPPPPAVPAAGDVPRPVDPAATNP